MSFKEINSKSGGGEYLYTFSFFFVDMTSFTSALLNVKTLVSFITFSVNILTCL